MEEQTNFLNDDARDTTPEVSGAEENIENDGIDAVTPDSDEPIERDVARDADSQFTQGLASEQKAVTEPFVSVQYNHKNRDFTKEEAVNFIQKGMHTESLRTKLEYLAKTQGTDLNTLVDRLVSAPERAYKRYLEQLYGEGHENVETGMKIYREQQADEYKTIMSGIENGAKVQQEFKNTNSRLADEYIELKNQIPDAPEYSALPDSVIMDAVQGKRDLYSAYLCYLHKEKMKIDAAKKTSEASDAASLGKMSNTDADFTSSADRNFLSGLWSK